MSFSTFFLLGRVSFALDHLPLLNCRCTFCRLGHLPLIVQLPLFHFFGHLPLSICHPGTSAAHDICRPGHPPSQDKCHPQPTSKKWYICLPTFVGHDICHPGHLPPWDIYHSGTFAILRHLPLKDPM